MNKNETLQQGDIVILRNVNGHAPIDISNPCHWAEQPKADSLYEVDSDRGALVSLAIDFGNHWRTFLVHKMHIELATKAQDRPPYICQHDSSTYQITHYKNESGRASYRTLATISKDTPISELQKALQWLKIESNENTIHTIHTNPAIPQ